LIVDGLADGTNEAVGLRVGTKVGALEEGDAVDLTDGAAVGFAEGFMTGAFVKGIVGVLDVIGGLVNLDRGAWLGTLVGSALGCDEGTTDG